MTQKARSIRRRDFLKATAATTAGFTIINPRSVRGSQANSAVRLGILGVGGRGTAVGSGFVTNAGVRVTALADLFADQLEAGRAHFDGLQAKAGAGPLAPSQLFRGPDCYKQIADTKDVDVIQISTPPYFHPLHLEAVSGQASTRTARSRWRSTCLARSGSSKSGNGQRAD
jgi:myo-inositol 2-dehydrogenase/D-chiro-inositol 1-dehydrogenase